ncbi:MAG: protein TonB [Crocinitomicaceae bacterium]|jgi:protein TonB
MIAKKNSRYDLERKRTALFAMGLLAAGSFTLAAFTYDSPFSVEIEKRTHTSERIDYDIQQVEKEVPKDKDVVKPVVPNDAQQSNPTIDAQANPDQNMVSADNTSDAIVPEVGIDGLGYDFGADVPVFDELDAEIFIWVDKEASMVGGVSEMFRYIQSTVEYPEMDIEGDVQGTVTMSFVVEKDGEITNIFVEKGVSKTIDREAKRIVRSFPKWVPAEIDARKVRTRVRLPIVFTLE